MAPSEFPFCVRSFLKVRECVNINVKYKFVFDIFIYIVLKDYVKIDRRTFLIFLKEIIIYRNHLIRIRHHSDQHIQQHYDVYHGIRTKHKECPESCKTFNPR